MGNTMMGRRGVVWKTPSISADGLKNFACVMMMVQTIGISIVEHGLIKIDQYTQSELSQAMAEDGRWMMLAGVGSIMQLLGGMAVPIFAFLLVEGFKSTSSYRNYLLTMMVFAVLSEVPYDLANSGKWWDLSSQNALVTMTICLLMLYFLSMIEGAKGVVGRFGKIGIVLCALVWATLFKSNCGLAMVLLTAIFYLLYTRNVLKTILGILVSLLYVTGPLSFYGIWCYTGERKNKIPKYAYYVFYSLHLLAAGMIMKVFL